MREQGTVGIRGSTNETHIELIERYGDGHAGPLLHIRRNEFGGLKTDPSVRVLPLHSEFVWLGFLDDVSTIRDLGYRLLFPDIDTAGTKSKHPA